MKKTNRLTKTLAAAVAAMMMMTTAVSFMASADNENAGTSTAAVQTALPTYDVHPTVEGSFRCDSGYDLMFRYSDGLFEENPFGYNAHMATMSDILAEASTTYVKNGDYSNGAKSVKEVLEQCGFENREESESYTVKPTADSIACAFGSKDIETADGEITVILITIRSAGYEAEWASNVTLGDEGEAKGFADSADQVVRYLDEYLDKHPALREAAEAGKASFWLQGFSRGGAVANLTAKRLIDEYQTTGDKFYAYTMEAPQGGIASAEKADRDYSCNHNVVNKDDLVPFVAPSDMGFKRYGVDHYVNDTTFNTDAEKN